MLNFFYNRSLSTKLLIILVPILLINQMVDLYVLRMTRDQIYEETVGAVEENVTLLANAYWQDLQAAGDGLNALSMETAVQDYMACFYARDNGTETTYRQQALAEGAASRRLFDFLLLNRSLSGCGIMYSASRFLFRNPYSYTITNEMLQEIIEQLHQVSEPGLIYVQDANQTLALYIYPIPYKTDTYYLVAQLKPTYCASIISKYERADTRYFVFSHTGQTLYAPTDADTSDIQKARLMSYRTEQSEEENGALYMTRVSGQSGWSVVSVSHSLYPAAAIRHIGKVSVIARGTVSVLSLSLLAAVVLFFSRRIRAVNTVMESVENGDLDDQFHSEYVDEISQLGLHLNQMMACLKEQTSEISRRQEQIKTAQLQALQNQINPHFLYNSLEYVRMKALDPVTGEEGEAAQAIRGIAEMLRYNVSNQLAIVTVQQEYDQMCRYLGIQKKLLQDRLQVKMDVDQQAMSCPVIKFLLQPLAENAVLHGIEPKVEPSELYISIRQALGRVRFVVRDTGIGMDPVRLATLQLQLSSGGSAQEEVGLQNVNDRLILFYGQESALTIRSISGEGTEVLFSIPVRDA